MPQWSPRAAAPHPEFTLDLHSISKSADPATHHLMEIVHVNIQKSLRLPSMTRTDMRRMSFLLSTPTLKKILY